MKKIRSYTYSLLLTLLFIAFSAKLHAQEDAAKTVIKLNYYNNNNGIQYLLLSSMLKKNKILTPVANKKYKLYLDSSNEATLIAELRTDAVGIAKTFISPRLKKAYESSASHTFILMDSTEEVINDYTITRTKLSIDTATEDGVRNITASVMKWQDSSWAPAGEVEMKVGIRRQGGILPAGEEETYTTDSTGLVTVAVNKLKMPGDENGNYIIAARVDENEFYGNLLVEKTVPWGMPTKIQEGFFDQRTLWSTQMRTPLWLLFMAYSIVIAVWGCMIYLIFQIFKIKKLGDKVPSA